MNSEPCRPRAIFLIGMMASGKSSVGRHLARRLGWAFHDVDREIERRTGVTIAEIFEKEGEEGFRRRETAMMDELTARPRCVIAMGGGAPLRDANRALLERGLVIYLEASAAAIAARVREDRSRPLLQVEDRQRRVTELVSERAPVYEYVCNAKIDTSRINSSDAAARILELPKVQRALAEMDEEAGGGAAGEKHD